MTNSDDRVPFHFNITYTNYNEIVCPICGQRIKHPYTGSVTMEQIDEDINTCQWMEVCDEGDGTLGWTPICKNLHPYTLKSEGNKYIHYDIIELANTWSMPIEEKMSRVANFILDVYKDKGLTKEDINFTIRDGKIDSITLHDSIQSIYVNMDIDNDGNISFKSN